MEKFLTIRQFCDLCGIGRSTVYRENKAGRLPFRKIGRATRIALKDANVWQEQLTVSGRSSSSL